jgi:BirA family transcriptional regulator, biotin operon repressor / biotin---[acetyl-CoA-carboxylase] ligase
MMLACNRIWRNTMLNLLLAQLADGCFHSGERLGKELGVSRAAVWKALKRLEDDGFPLQRVRGKGYRIPRGAQLLDAARIRAELSSAVAERWNWHVFQDIDSTNAEAHRRVVFPLERPLACISEMQRAGRGRRGREWSSPFGQNIYLTLVEPFAGGAQRLEGLSLLVGLILVESLEQCGYQECKLKWPNDVLLAGRKLGGILVEIAGDLTSDCVVIIGVGVNVLMTQASQVIDQAWTSLLLSGQQGDLDRNRLVAVFASRMAEALDRFRVDGFAPFAQAWANRDAWQGLPVAVTAGSRVVQGINRGVNDKGALRLMTPAGEMLINGGEVSLRLDHAS